MSFILDALKKSESDRQQRSNPDISSVPTGTRSAATPRWLWVLTGLLGVNLVILTVVLLKPSSETLPFVSTVTLPTPVVDAATPAARMTPEVKPSSAARIPIIREVDAISSAPETASVSLPNEQAEPSQEEPVESSPEPIDRQSASAESSTQLTFNDLRASGDLSLPDLNIDIHVYSEKPADRFVFINMNQYRENATLAEGPLLREITTEGVILDFAGATFLLPRE